MQRFAEPALLLVLCDGPSHGYELADRLAGLVGADVDFGNLYRLLRALEHEGVVTSTWDDDAPGRSKRMYELTDHGSALLDAWATALTSVDVRIQGFLELYNERTTT